MTDKKSEPPKQKRVVIIQRRMTHYRIPVFTAMRERLASSGVDLNIVYGDATRAELFKKDEGNLPWGIHVPCHYYFGDRICWQNIKKEVAGADLVIVGQENKLIYNLILHLQRTRFKLAYWGHGRNFHAKPSHFFLEWFKSWLLRQVDWWFGYTNNTLKVLQEFGFPLAQTTVLNNSIDTSSIQTDLDCITENDREIMRTSLGLSNAPIGLMLGSLYAEKRLDFLIQAVTLIRKKCPNFQLVIIGDGPERNLVEQAITLKTGGIFWAGARTGKEKATLLSMSCAMLNPGVFGLTVLDSFIAQLPLLTTEFKTSMPESAYLEPDINCLIIENSLTAYADAVVNFLNDKQLQTRLRAGCAASAKEYTIGNMTERFCNGILQALAATKPTTILTR